jgi:hypothetical protein
VGVVSGCKSCEERLFGGDDSRGKELFSEYHGSASSIWRKALPVSSAPIHQKFGRAKLLEKFTSLLVYFFASL